MSGYGNSRHARRTKPMSKATQCSEALFEVMSDPSDQRPLRVAFTDVLRRFYPEEETTVTHYQNPAPTNSLRMIDEGRDV